MAIHPCVTTRTWHSSLINNEAEKPNSALIPSSYQKHSSGPIPLHSFQYSFNSNINAMIRLSFTPFQKQWNRRL